MTITQTYFASLRAEGQLQYESLSGSRRHWSPLHMQQSPLDRACGTHALLVAIALVSRTPRSAFEKMTEASRGPWRRLWAMAVEHYFEGTSPKDLETMAACISGISTRRVRIGGPDQLHRVCLATIESGGVPLLDIQGPNIAHWTVALGVETRMTEPSAVLCLDPSCGEPWATFTNARLDISRPVQPARGKPLFNYRDTDGHLKLARARSVLAVHPAAAMPSTDSNRRSI